MLKIFEIIYNDGEKQWIAATTNIEALQLVLCMENTDIGLMEKIEEVPESKLDEMTVFNSDSDNELDWKSKTFRQYIQDEKSATIIAATFYD